MTAAKNEVFIGLSHTNCYLVEGINLWWGDKNLAAVSLLGQIFLSGGVSKFLARKGGLSLSPQ